MTRILAAGVVWSIAVSVAAYADVPASVQPFLDDKMDEDNVKVLTGAFGPKGTMFVVTSSIYGHGSFPAFVLVPDAKAKSGMTKRTVPKLPEVTMDGAIPVAFAANLDADKDDEIVVELHVSRTGPGGNYTYGTYDFAVLDWNGKTFARVRALENKLAAQLKKQLDTGNEAPLSQDDIVKLLAPAK